jgi:hypothetical protein
MASNHVPSDQVPGQSMYTDTSYQHLFSAGDRYSNPSWDAQLNQHAGLAPNNAASTQAWQHGSYPQQPYSTHGQSYGTHTQAFPSASPYHYAHFGQSGSLSSYSQPSNVDPSLGLDPNALRQQQQSPYSMPMRNSTPQAHSSTVTPQALQHNPVLPQNNRPVASPYQVSLHYGSDSFISNDLLFQVPRSTSEMFAQRAMPSANVKPVPVPSFEIPKGKKSGGLYVLDQAALAKATKSTALNKLVTLGSESFHLPTNRGKLQRPTHKLCNPDPNAAAAALPLYTSRQSVRELKKVGADNKKLLAKLSSSKPSVAKALKTRTYAASPSDLKREVTDSESDSDSSDDESEYTDDEEEEVSPLPSSRPEEPHQAVRYDVIKATWCPQNPSPSKDRIRAGMRDIWEVLNTIYKRWRTDTQAVKEAEEQKNIGELPVLKSRVASQRDLLQSALEAAIDHAHLDILYHLGQMRPFVVICYQFLANRFHSKDFDGPLSAVIYEVLSRCGTLTSELLEDTKLAKALTSMKKQANDKHKALIQQVVETAAGNSKKAKANSPPVAGPTETKGVKRPATEPANRSSAEGPAAKKPKPVEGSSTAAKKLPATLPNTKLTTTSSNTLPQKRPMATSAPVKARVNQVTNKPSGIFASLNAASKKPTPTAAAPKASTQSKPATAAVMNKKPTATSAKPAFSFAQTMASLAKPTEKEVVPVKSEKELPPETPEEKAKRLRKEARRHLRVAFKPDAALVQIKYFSHDPDEELGHEENFVRHAGDIGGEGRMFKQHKELDEDEDDEDGDGEVKLKPWKGEPSQVDFSLVPSLAREGNYVPFGGGQKMPSCPEKDANARRENATLMVFYADPKDIPSSPREPLEQAQDAAPAVAVTSFGTPPEKVFGRAPQTAVPAPVMMPDMQSLENIFKQFANNPMATAPQSAPAPQSTYIPPAMSAPPPDIHSILSALSGSGPPQSSTPVPFAAQAPVQHLPPMPTGPPPPGFELAAFVAQGGVIPPPPPGFLPFTFPAPPQQSADPYHSQHQAQYNAQPNGGVKRQREESNSNDWGQGKKHKHRGDRPHKVLPCKFFQKGTCNKGDNCTYVHDLNM